MRYPDWLNSPKPRPTYVIAEIGQNHNGDFEIAKELICAAADAGAQAVKFQKRTLPDCIPEDQRDTTRIIPGVGEVSYLEYRTRLEFDWGTLNRLRCCAEDVGLDAFVSVWDRTAAEGLLRARGRAKSQWSCVKIPSAAITDEETLAAAADVCVPVIISTGMSTSTEILNATRALSPRRLTILHCHSAYPAPTEELNLRCIETLHQEYPGATIGYSGHEWGIATTVWAVILGAEVIERHITLRRGMWGSDHFSSLEPDIFKKLVKHIRSVPNALGTGEKKLWESEMAKRASLRG